MHDITEFESHSFLTMEFIDGEDLSSVLKRLGRVPEEKGVDVARQLCSAPVAVHDQGLPHRDLNPANVMLDGRGKVPPTDFGLSPRLKGIEHRPQVVLPRVGIFSQQRSVRSSEPPLVVGDIGRIGLRSVFIPLILAATNL